MFQKVANWIKGWKSPSWFISLTNWLQNVIIVPTLQSIGSELWQNLQGLVIEANKMNVSGQEKAVWVFQQFRITWPLEKISNHLLNLVIELCVAELKKKGVI